MTLHKIASSREECAKLTIENVSSSDFLSSSLSRDSLVFFLLLRSRSQGLSVEMGGGTYTFFTLEDQVAAGTVNESLIDRTLG